MRSLDAGAPPPRPVMAFQVGVSGHRALPHADAGALRTEAAALFRALRTEVLRLHAADQAADLPLYQPAPPALRCICGLAEGADSILAEAALAEGWTVVAALPFARDEFARDFPPGPILDRFHALLRQAATVCELDGARGRGGEPYADVGRQIVEQSDVVLVVWDGLPPRGPGGTGDVANQALERGLPVAVLPPSGPVTTAWRGAGTGDIPTLVQSALLPPSEPGNVLHAYLQDVPRGAGWAGAAVRWYERAVLVGTPPAAPAPTVEAAPPSPAVAAAEESLLPYFLPADRLATEYAARYRVAGLMRYGLILPATLGAFIGFFADPWLRPAGFLLQFASLAAVVWFSARGGWDRSHRRFIAYRALAEYLRNARLLLPLGAVAQAPGAAVHQARAADWTAWYGRASVRTAGLLPERLDSGTVAAASAFLRTEAAGQVAYLLGRADRFSAIAGRLQRIGASLFMCGIGFAAVRALLMLGGVGSRTTLLISELGLVLPALAPVFLGLLSFGEYGRLATRYRAVAAELQAQIAALDRAGPGRAAVLRVARRIADVMLAEGADWQLLIKARTVSAY